MRSSRDSDVVDCEPPELPVKLRVKPINHGPTTRPMSHFDNSTTDYFSTSATSVAGSHSSTRSSCTDSYTTCHRFGMIGDESQSNKFAAMTRLSDKPPPLPPKKKNIMAYMQNMGGCYYTPTEAALNLYRASYHYSQQHHQSQTQRQVELSFMEHRSFRGSKCSASSDSDESVWSSGSQASVPNSTIPPPLPLPLPSCPPPTRLVSNVILKKVESVPPLLPPKLKSDRRASQGSLTATTSLPATSPLRPGPPSDSGVSEQSSQSGGSSPSSSTKQDKQSMKGPLDCVDMSPWILVKNDSEKGPEIVGGTLDGLLVKATEVSKTGEFNDFCTCRVRMLSSALSQAKKVLYMYMHIICWDDLNLEELG